MKHKSDSKRPASDAATPASESHVHKDILHRELLDEVAALRTILDDLLQRIALREGARLAEIEQLLCGDKVASEGTNIDTVLLEQALGLIRESKLDGRKGRLHHLQRFNVLSKKLLAMFDMQS